MAKRLPGNGSSSFPIHQTDMGGWVRLYSEPTAALPNNFGVYLSHALTEWFRQRPHLRMRCVVPIVFDGSTAELHAWYDQGVFPDFSTVKPASGSKS